MILFKKLRYKNFLSTGDYFIEIDLLKNDSTLIVGGNGAGKSTMLDALSYSLFGKAHRNINKPQLINSVNKKGMLVEVEFTIGSSDFKVVRGIRPNKFEIWKDNVLINQDSHNKEYQKFLEQNILKLNHKSFHQIVVLGSSNFIPFMQLPAHHRRQVIEDLLDIVVFSRMNQLLREDMSLLKSKLYDNEHKINILETKIEAHEKYINEIERINDENKQQKVDAIASYEKEIDVLNNENQQLQKEVREKKGALEKQLQKLKKTRTSLADYTSQFKNQLAMLTKQAEFFEVNPSCPTCEQDIDDELAKKKVSDANEKTSKLEKVLENANVKSQEIEENVKGITSELSIINEKEIKIGTNNTQITQFRNLISKDSNFDTEDLLRAKAESIEFNQELEEIKKSKSDNMLQDSYNQVKLELLKDTGIKTKIIKQYIPVINQLVNKYLQILDFYVRFQLDESFKETIKSRHRDEFSYDSFSEGEKSRIDLALLFTWRQVAKMKNSVSTNLLILDETFDSSLDVEGIDNLTKILYNLGNSCNVFIISHKGELLEGKFDSKIEFYKHKNFTRIR